MSVGEQLAAVLNEWQAGKCEGDVSPEDLADIRSHLEVAAEEAIDASNLAAGDRPIRLSKARIRHMLDCERYMLAMLRPRSASVSNALVMGVILDALANHRVTSGRLDDRPLELALGILEATGQSDEVIAWVRDLDPGMREALGADVAKARDALLLDWPALPPEWWPRCQERALVWLAGGGVILESRADVVLGGPPTSPRAAIIELKSRQLRREDLEHSLLYALMLALRDGRAPAAVITCCSSTSGVDTLWINGDDLRSATRRLEHVIRLAGELAGGRAPTETPGSRCGWCPDSSVCPSAMSGGGAQVDEEPEADDDPF